MPLRVVIVHYHLRPGGVTRVIENAVRSLAAHDIETLVITGEPYTGDVLRVGPQLPGFQGVRVTAALRYTQPNERPVASALAYDIHSIAREIFGGDPDLYHLHNHSLGKNNAFPDAVRRLAQNTPLLLQIHDFAEDGRPANYRQLLPHLSTPKALYPLGDHVHYALLNRRDRDTLIAAGLPEAHAHYLPNPVAVAQEEAVSERERRHVRERLLGEGPGNAATLFIYPTRGIRRKNLGEMLLWASLAEPNTVFASTLSPANPNEQPVYEDWVRFADAEGLPVLFGVGEEKGMTFPGILAAADWTLTTSVAEGFGLAYLEPFLAQRVILGRDLPDITADFREVGVNLEHLYARLDVPLDAVDAPTLRVRLDAKLDETYQAYGQPRPNDATEIAFADIVRDDHADFGRLDETLQQAAIRALRGASPQELPRLPFPQGEATALCQANAEKVRAHFSLEAQGQLLADLYRQVAGSSPGSLDSLEPEKLLQGFLDPKRFNLLRA
ncbi:MAG: glycosyltransferase [Opitutales bacterium]